MSPQRSPGRRGTKRARRRRESSGERRRGFGDALGRARRQRLQGRLETFVDHSGTDVGPARGLMLLRKDFVAVLELAPDRQLQRVEIEAGLCFEALVKESADLEELVDRLVDLLFAPADRECVDDQ